MVLQKDGGINMTNEKWVNAGGFQLPKTFKYVGACVMCTVSFKVAPKKSLIMELPGEKVKNLTNAYSLMGRSDNRKKAHLGYVVATESGNSIALYNLAGEFVAVVHEPHPGALEKTGIRFIDKDKTLVRSEMYPRIPSNKKGFGVKIEHFGDSIRETRITRVVCYDRA